MDMDVIFLMEAAKYFEKRPTNDEDQAQWANIYNAENCRRIARRIEAFSNAGRAVGDDPKFRP